MSDELPDGPHYRITAGDGATVTLEPVGEVMRLEWWADSAPIGGLIKRLAAVAARHFQADEQRRYWAGPNRDERRMLRRYGPHHIGPVRPSAFDARYRIRQRNRRRRQR